MTTMRKPRPADVPGNQLILFPTPEGQVPPPSVSPPGPRGAIPRSGPNGNQVAGPCPVIALAPGEPSAPVGLRNRPSLHQGPGPFGSSDPALSPGGEPGGRREGPDSRSPSMNNPPAPEPGNRGRNVHQPGARAKAGGTDPGCIGPPTQAGAHRPEPDRPAKVPKMEKVSSPYSLSATPASGGQADGNREQFELRVPINNLVEIWRVLRPILTGADLPTDPPSTPSGCARGGPGTGG